MKREIARRRRYRLVVDHEELLDLAGFTDHCVTSMAGAAPARWRSLQRRLHTLAGGAAPRGRAKR
jgi:hypothetical protein